MEIKIKDKWWKGKWFYLMDIDEYILFTLIFLFITVPIISVGIIIHRSYRYQKFVLNTLQDIKDERSNCIGESAKYGYRDIYAIAVTVKSCGVYLPTYYQYNSNRKLWEKKKY